MYVVIILYLQNNIFLRNIQQQQQQKQKTKQIKYNNNNNNNNIDSIRLKFHLQLSNIL